MSADGKLLYSKLQTGKFPEEKAILNQVESLLSGASEKIGTKS